MDEYLVRIPDPGATWSDYRALLTRLEKEPGIDYVAGVTARSVFRVKADPHVTARIPAIPDPPVVDDDPRYIVRRPGTLKSIYYRRLFDIKFRATATANQVTQFFARYSAEIVGGSPDMGVYTVRVPDPGTNWNDVEALRLAMPNLPAVESARLVGRVTPAAKPEGR